MTVGITANWGSPFSPYSRADKSASQSTLELLCKKLVRKPVIDKLPERGPNAMNNMVTFLLVPSIAKALANKRYSKKGIRDYLYDNAKIPLQELE